MWQWDDDYPIDGFHQAPTEWYQYFTVCPDPAGAMMATWVAGDLCPCDWDLHADCDTDFADLTALLADYGTSYDFQDIVDCWPSSAAPTDGAAHLKGTFVRRVRRSRSRPPSRGPRALPSRR